MEVYNLKGRINQVIYDFYLKPFLMKRTQKIEHLIENIRFVVLSECKDTVMLKKMYELVVVKYKQEKIKSSWHIYQFHLYTHYLQTQNYKIKLPPILTK